MSYRDEDSDLEKGGFGKKLLGIGAGLVAFFVVKALVGGGMDLFRQKSTTPQSVEQRLISEPAFAAYAQPMKEHFPDDYSKLLSGVSELVRSGSSQQEISAYSFKTSRQFVKTHMRDISAASTSTLAEIATAHANLTVALAEASTSACSQFGFEGLQPGATDSLPKSIQAKFLEPARLMIIAAHEGRNGNPRNAELSDQDVEALVETLQDQGMTQSQLEAFFSGTAKNAGVTERCKMTVALYSGVAALPDEQSSRITAFLLLNGS